MQTEHKLRASILDGGLSAAERLLGRGLMNRLAGYVYWRTRGENLDDPRRNGEYMCMQAVIRNVLGDSPIAFDVGANVGDWSTLFLEHAPRGRVHAFEPVGGTNEFLRGRFLNEPRVECHRLAVSDAPGTCVLRVGGNLSGSNSVYRMPDEVNVTEEEVPAVSGDSFAAARNIRQVDYLKIDVEGHEVQVVRGFRELIALRAVKCIQWEYNKTWIASRAALADMYEILGPAGYRLCKLRERDVLHYSSYSRSLDNYCYSNWVAVSPDLFPALGKVVRVETGTSEDW